LRDLTPGGELFCRIAGYTEKKFVFDLNPRQYRLSEVHECDGVDH
jgi:hypothetical protein